MNQSFTFHLPTKVHFGFGKIDVLRDLPFQASRAFIVTDKGVLNAGLLEGIINQLESTGISYEVYSDVEPDPSVETVDRAAHVFKESQCDLIISVGGGSPIDTAKGIRVVAGNGGSIRDYAGNNIVKEPSNIPLIAIPTTSGTGSEVTIFAVFSDWEENRKVTVVSPFLSPDLSIVDPELTMTAPASITAASGFDAFAHAAETFVSKAAQPTSDALALSAMKTAHKYLRRAVLDGTDIEARTKMAEASLLAGIAFNQSYLGLAHAIGSAISGHAHVSHGVAIGLLLPRVMEFNLETSIERYQDIGRVLFEDNKLSKRSIAEKVLEEVRQLRNDVLLPARLRDVNVKEDQLEGIAHDSIKSGMWKFNPREASVEEIQQLLATIF
ncbi:NAD-dependent alcohol dehydrogenase [Bacillus sp. M6-12]|uniref:iron-containing alcohol dehydrogenase family protein n=1 Tax=Bacillus sp. M6-12 TaxID=2054166 RepID=UPI000C78A20C|nr:iron-containing alcohol dehydrogenase [Bacillus sp. M6-12]PLS16030.1 NAD-dependent alcohol dehydrogenase [Bacillus sp. M6-12]